MKLSAVFKNARTDSGLLPKIDIKEEYKIYAKKIHNNIKEWEQQQLQKEINNTDENTQQMINELSPRIEIKASNNLQSLFWRNDNNDNNNNNNNNNSKNEDLSGEYMLEYEKYLKAKFIFNREDIKKKIVDNPLIWYAYYKDQYPNLRLIALSLLIINPTVSEIFKKNRFTIIS